MSLPQPVFTGITVWRAVFPLRVGFSHNLASRKEIETLLVRMDTSVGACGYGQVLPRTYLTGETMDTALQDITKRWWPAFRQLQPEGNGWFEAVRPIYAEADAERRNASFAGMEVAAWDAWARVKGLPKPAGGGEPVELVGVISASGPRKAAWLARMLYWLGFRRFKVKVGRDAGRDAKRIDAVRRVIGPGTWLGADANAAWEWDEALVRMEELRESGVVLMEEPLRPEVAAAADFKKLESETGIEVMADESLCTIADAEALLRRGSPSWWNVRLGKNGGFSGYHAMAAKARENGISIYGGILVGETGALAAAARQAWSMDAPVCGEYGFSRVFLRGDPFRGSPAGYRGIMRLAAPEGRGLGLGDSPCVAGEMIWRDETLV